MSLPFDDARARAFADAGIQYRPGMADDMLREMAPLLAEDGIDLDDPSTFDMNSLNTALTRAVERSNLERFSPIGKPRERSLIILRLTSEAVADGQQQVAEVVIRGIEPEPGDRDEASIAHVIGTGLGLLDQWSADARGADALTAARPPKWSGSAQSAATDILALARKGRAFDSVAGLHRRHSGLTILEGTVLAVTAALQAWAKRENTTVREIGLRVVV